RPVGEYRLPTPVVDDRRRAGRREATGKDPVTLRLEPLVERPDGSHLVLGGEARRIVNHGNQVLHRIISRGFPAPLVGGRSPLLRTRLPRSDTASRSYFKEVWQAGRERSDHKTVVR